MERKINWSMVASVLFAMVLSMLGYIVRQNDGRIDRLEAWRHEHEAYSRDQVVAMHSRLAAIETKLDQLLQEKKP